MKTIRRDTFRIGPRLAALVAVACAALCAGPASAGCSEKARALGKCPQAHAQTKAKSNTHVAGTTPTVGAPKTLSKNHGVPGVGPSPIEHSDKNALNPQPIPPGRPVHPLPPTGADEAGGH